MTANEIFAAVLADEQEYDVEQLAQVCGVSLDWVVTHVDAGVLAARGADQASWRFSGALIRRARVVNALERDFDALPELAALVADLQDEVARLRALLR